MGDSNSGCGNSHNSNNNTKMGVTASLLWSNICCCAGLAWGKVSGLLWFSSFPMYYEPTFSIGSGIIYTIVWKNVNVSVMLVLQKTPSKSYFNGGTKVWIYWCWTLRLGGVFGVRGGIRVGTAWVILGLVWHSPIVLEIILYFNKWNLCELWRTIRCQNKLFFLLRVTKSRCWHQGKTGVVKARRWIINSFQVYEALGCRSWDTAVLYSHQSQKNKH